MSDTSADGQIKRQGFSYRQGLVLGLTMAEIMVLLIFCLLIAMASFLRSEQSKRERVERDLSERQVQNERDRGLVMALRQNQILYDRIQAMVGSNDSRAVDEFWRELVDSRTIVAQFEKSGMSSTELRARVSEAAALHEKGIDVDKAVRNAEVVGSIERVLPGVDKAVPSTQAIIDAIQRGISGPGPTGHRWPPIITLSEAGGYFFRSGSAELSPRFKENLQTATPEQILRNIKQFDVDVIEVVGHTDEQPLGLRVSNLDRDLSTVLKNASAIATLQPADNAGLGLARAVSVVSVLRQSPLLAGYKLIPLSGAQLVNTDETLAENPNPVDVLQRRRIEIRLRKSVPQTISAAAIQATVANSPKPRPRPIKPKAPAAPLQLNRMFFQPAN